MAARHGACDHAAQLKESRNFTIRERGRRPWLPQQQKFQPTIIPVPPAHRGCALSRADATARARHASLPARRARFASIVASQARITQLSGEIDDAKSELTNAQSYNDYLSTTMDQITNSTSVQQEAEDRLGLVKMDPSQVTYVRLEDESVIERAAGTADKFFAGIKTAALSLLGSFDPKPIRSRQYRITLGAQAVRWESCGAALTLRQSVHPNRSTLFLPSWAGAYSCKQSFL